MERQVIILEGEFSEETNQRIAEFLEYVASLEAIQNVSVGGGGFINIKPRP